MAEMRTILIQDRLMPMFSRGSDLFRLKVLRYISSKGMYECFYLSDMKKRFKVKQWKICKIMNDFTEQGILEKIKSYPVFWKRTEIS